MRSTQYSTTAGTVYIKIFISFSGDGIGYFDDVTIRADLIHSLSTQLSDTIYQLHVMYA